MTTTPSEPKPGNVRVTIVHPNGSTKTTVEVPQNVPVQRLVQALVPRIGLPAVNQDGRPVAYRLVRQNNREGDEEEQEINPTTTLADSRVQNDNVLRLYADMQAGLLTGGFACG
jgi:hypothetical protein